MAEPIRFLIVIDNFHPLVGGAEQAALNTAQALTHLGHVVEVVTMRKDPDWPAEEKLGEVAVRRFDERVPLHPFGWLLYERANAEAARRFIEERFADHPPDVMLLHPIDAAFGAVRTRLADGARVVYCFHAPLAREHWVEVRGLEKAGEGRLRRLSRLAKGALTASYRARQQRAAIGLSDAVTCPSDYSRDLLEDMMRPSVGRPVRVIPWGVDLEAFRPAADRAALRAELGWVEGEFVVLTARRLVPRMGLGPLLHGFGQAAGADPALRLVVVGDGPLRGRLEALARRAGGRVEFTGFLPTDELIKRLQAADLFVLPSIELEAFGLVILEAMACGTPVVATHRCAAPEIIGPLDRRLLVHGYDASSWADALAEARRLLAAEPTLRQRCRDYVERHYSWEKTATAFEKLARELLARPKHR